MRPSSGMTEWIILRIPTEQKRRLKAAARQRHLTLSEFVRQTATEASSRVEA
ncbi:type II toxin -antitoxin system TacA 1-like antitoxin [Bradyrhizobium sp. Arg314]